MDRAQRLEISRLEYRISPGKWRTRAPLNLSRRLLYFGCACVVLISVAATPGGATPAASPSALPAVEASSAPANSTGTYVLISSATLPEPKTDSAIDRRLQYERYNRSNPFVLTPHRPNYFLPGTYNFDPNPATFDTGNPRGRVQNAELKFQLSFKVNLIREMIKDRGNIYVAYTQQSFWQAYNTRNSSPFRETNYEPETGLALFNDWGFLGIRNRVIVVALCHQSNGRSGLSSRSWNRVFGEFLFQKNNFYATLRPWYRLPESASTDDNPDIARYMGNGELYLNYAFKKQVFGIMVRNNFRSDNKGAIQADWTFPLVSQFKGYIQYFNGYGESLIDYNHIDNRIGLGFSISNWI